LSGVEELEQQGDPATKEILVICKFLSEE